MTNEKLREALNALDRVEAWMLSEEGAFMDFRDGERDLKTIRAALSSTDSQSVGDDDDDDATARRYLRDAVVNRDPTGASIRKMNQFGTVDEGAAVDAIMAILSASPAVQSEPSGDDVERVARALAKSDGHDPDELRGRLDVDGKWPVWHAYRQQAEAAISAMSSREAGLREAATALLDKLDIVTKETAGVFAEMYARGRPYDVPNFSEEYDALRAALNAGGDRG